MSDEYSIFPVDEEQEDLLPETWQLSSVAKRGLEKARKQFRSQHGLFAGVPIICKGPSCPYASSCPLQQERMAPIDDRCPIEIVYIQERFRGYTEQLNIQPDNLVDVGLLKDLIDAEILIDRCDKILAEEGNVVQNIVAAISNTGKVMHKPEVHVALTIKERQQRRKNEILQLLNSTRRDMAKENQKFVDLSKFASDIMQKFSQMKQDQEAIDADYELSDEELD